MEAGGLAERFLARYGYRPAAIARAPGRIHMIGGSAGDVDGLAIDMAIDLECVVAAGPAVPHPDLLIESSIPPQAGLASAAALRAASALALGSPLETSASREPAICHAREGSALLVDRRAGTCRPLKLPEGIALLIVDAKVRRPEADSIHEVRAAECRQAAHRMGIASLREVAIAHWRALDGDLLARVRHVVSEADRVESFAAACEAADAVRLGQLLVASHRSLQRDYRVSCSELDFLTATALSVQGVIGARMAGPGFGGCTLNLMHPKAEEPFRERISRSYLANFGREATIHRCRPCGGASKLFPAP